MVLISWIRTNRSRFFIRPVMLRAGENRDAKGVSLILVIKDEADRVPYFLEYYRRLGVTHFFILDNQSTDDLEALLKQHQDVSYFLVTQNYQDSRYGVDWINYIARKYCQGSWVLSVDSDELLVFPHCETRSVDQLCDFLDSQNIKKLYTPMIDMYSEKPVMDTAYERGQDPLEQCCYFDGAGYFTVTGGFGNPWVRGGVRMRVFNRDSPLDSPALNKFALVKWDRMTFYYRGAHTMLPKRKNTVHFDSLKVSGALLHFKFFDDLYRKSVYAVEHGNHYQGSTEYELYLSEMQRLESSLKYENSAKYTGFQSLVDVGLAVQAEW